MQETDAVQVIDGAQELDGEEHDDSLVQDAWSGGGVAGEVCEVEEGALVAVFFYQVAFVSEEVERVGFGEGVGGASMGEAGVGESHDVEFPGCGWVFGFDGVEDWGVVVVGGGLFGEVDGSEGAFAEFAMDGVGGGCVGEGEGWWG